MYMNEEMRLGLAHTWISKKWVQFWHHCKSGDTFLSVMAETEVRDGHQSDRGRG